MQTQQTTTETKPNGDAIARRQAELDDHEAEVEKLEKQYATAEAQRASAKTRAEFDAARSEGEGEWLALQLERAKTRRDAKRGELNEAIGVRNEELRKRDEAAMLSMIRRIGEAVDGTAAAINETAECVLTIAATINEFDRLRRGSRCAMSLEHAQIARLCDRLNQEITRSSGEARIAYVATGDPGLLEVRISLPVSIPLALRG